LKKVDAFTYRIAEFKDDFVCGAVVYQYLLPSNTLTRYRVLSAPPGIFAQILPNLGGVEFDT